MAPSTRHEELQLHRHQSCNHHHLHLHLHQHLHHYQQQHLPPTHHLSYPATFFIFIFFIFFILFFFALFDPPGTSPLSLSLWFMLSFLVIHLLNMRHDCFEQISYYVRCSLLLIEVKFLQQTTIMITNPKSTSGNIA